MTNELHHHCLGNFVKDKSEWKDTDILFDIAKKGDKTEVRFTHVGLSPHTNATTSARTPGEAGLEKRDIFTAVGE